MALLQGSFSRYTSANLHTDSQKICDDLCSRRPRQNFSHRIPAPARAHASRRSLPCAAAAAAAEVDYLTYGSDLSTPQDSYLVLGLAHCFERSDDGKLQDVFVIEPVSANSLECMVAGANTCFKSVTSLKLSEALQRSKEPLPEEFAEGRFCQDYEFRCEASARTWGRPHAQDNLMGGDARCIRGRWLTLHQGAGHRDIVPLGTAKANFNYSLDEKRVLNMENVVNDADNVKQDMSIDVYGRKEDTPEETAPTDAAEEGDKKAVKADDDGLDDLFSD